MTPRNILFINGHPDAGSFGAVLETSYLEAAKAAGHTVRVLRIRELSFDPILHHGYRLRQNLEADLERAKLDIDWAQHLVILYPTWWGSLPALLKGFFDRILHSGWAYKVHKGRLIHDRLLKGRTAHLITTMGAPSWFDLLFYRRSGYRTLAYAILWYCGIKVKKFTVFDNLTRSTPEKRTRYLKKMEALGRRGV
ncbi:hypothetical protein A3C89_00140 [Candidatus Kaiserbacteria bacterium RIFCSPHIGHO2_02_FULL_50_50]|uniref:Flavodoxin-like fold domain-containing protein n=1 Tax=Candidatus Kaiserbacteria bacterium RIFCSPHIGHO2_02_FULL_50_50 TaxID=1798492 RepID=A0A1F6DE14_9BACT|nr:MAG: hypothetical protein A3C89_00140 [Candidatus Kaiserbacteria bacterium RIFCSPHIGHO2_02_FULL_50_50]OGG88676.1 MAG: hypothetical protein A3G62_02000 [Candidatus Kaiserbacteria bacterium RIFCSPLOWO2_12_FULL_50_10]